MVHENQPDLTLMTTNGCELFLLDRDLFRKNASDILLCEMVKGVSEGHTVTQELVGVGYKVSNQGNLVEFVVGYSHKILLQVPSEITVTTLTEKGKNPSITMVCTDKQLLGQVAAKIRSFRKPEPYKGKGIKFSGEVLRKKAGKSASKK